MEKTIFGQVLKPGRGHSFREHTVEVLINILRTFPPDALILLPDLNKKSCYRPLGALIGAHLFPDPHDSESLTRGSFRELNNGPINAVLISTMVGKSSIG